MTNQDLRIFGGLRPGEERDPAEGTEKDQVEQAYGHSPHPAGYERQVPANPQIRAGDTITGTHSLYGHGRAVAGERPTPHTALIDELLAAIASTTR
jgi:hypothetical protein